MSGDVPQVQRIEKPRESADRLVTLEADTLERQASSAAFRDVHERTQHLASLNRRIEVLQSKLDAREIEVRKLLPRVAELEQASRGVTLACVYYTGMMVVGGGAISAAGYVHESARSFALLFGWLLVVSGIVAHWVSSIWQWPLRKKD